MALYNKLANLQKLEESPKVSLKELTRTEGYRILGAKRVDTRFERPVIMLDVELDAEGTAYVTFLPSRFTDSLGEEDLATLSKGHRIRCTGVTGNSPDVHIWCEEPQTSRKKSARK